MLLLFDVGNSNVGIAAYENETLIEKWRIKTDINKTADDYSITLNTLLAKYQIEDVVIGSVVPIITNLLITYCKKYLNIEPITLVQGIKTGLDIRLNNPKEIGADLVATALGSINHYPQPTIIVDMGTATKITLVDNNTFHGGAIIPGVEISLHGLVNATALLPHIDIKAPKRVIEKETVSCMQSGIVYGTAATIDGMIDKIESEYGKKCFVVATGGLAKYIIPHCSHQITLDKFLIYKGLIEIFKKNKE